MDGYNHHHGYHGYGQQQQQQQQLYGSGSRNPPPPGGPPQHHGHAPAQPQPFYGAQHSGYTYNFNYIPPPPAAAHSSYTSSRVPAVSSHVMQPSGYPSSQSYPSSSSTGRGINTPPMNPPHHQQPRQYSSSAAAASPYNNSPAYPPAPSPSSSSSRYNPSHSHHNHHHHQQQPRPHASQPLPQLQRQNSYQSQHSPSSSSVYNPPAHNSISKGIQAPTTLDEALQYTPLNSILPYHGHIIPTPTIDASSLAARSEQVGKKLLKDFNRLDPLSKRFRTATSDISGYINSTIEKKGVQLEFKKSKIGSSTNKPNKSSIDDLLQNSGLGAFETAVLHKLPAYNQPFSKGPSLSNLEDSQQSSDHTSTLPPVTKTPLKVPKGGNHTVLSHQPSPATPRSTFYIEIPPVSSIPPSQTKSNGYEGGVTPSQLQLQPEVTSASRIKGLPESQHPSGQVLAAIVLPPPKDGFTPTDYTTHEEADARIQVSNFKARKRRKIGEQDDHEAQVTSVDTRAKAESAVSHLQSLLIKIFEDEDNLQPDTSGNVASTSSGTFIPPGAIGFSLETNAHCLSLGTQVRLDHAIRQVVLYNGLERMDIDDILRLIKTCDNTLKAAENLDVKVGDNFEEASDAGGPVSEWDRKIAFAENSVKACRTILRVLNGGRQEKQLYSEEVLNSIHNVIKSLLEGSIVPLVALRSDSDTTFKAAMSKKKLLRDLLQDITKILKLLTQLLSKQEVTEDFLIKMIYTSVSLVFIDNASNDKDSVFGLKKVESLRLASMNVLAKIFARYPDQGDHIITEVLTNLEKLPVGRQSAKNFQIGNSSIQLISAFVMNLVQSAGTYQERLSPSTMRKAIDSDEEMTNDNHGPEGATATNGPHPQDAETIVFKLEEVIQRSTKTAQEKTAYVTSYIVNKALITAKSSESSNSRNLLDLMVEDFLEVLDNPEWPASELFLKIICIKMIHTIDDPKSPVPAKSAALEILGKLGSRISSLFSHLKKIHGDKGAGDSSIDGILSILTENFLEYHSNSEGKGLHELKEERDAVLRKMVLWKGPFKMILEFLWDKDQKEDADNLQTAWGFFASVWANRLVSGFEQSQETDASLAADIAHVSDNLLKMITEKAWYDEADEINSYKNNLATPMQIRQAYLLITLAGDFCQHNRIILTRLIHSIDGEQTSARSKGLKALMNIVEQDLSILDDRGLIPTLLSRCKDASPSVRDSALDIIGKCLNMKPELEPQVLPTICTRAHDLNVPLRKRAIKLLREIYPNTKFPDHKVDIAKCLLMRVVDHENQVAEQARKSFEDLWINQYYPQLKDGEDGELSLKGKVIIRERVGVITKVVITNDKLDAPLSTLIQFFLDPENKQVEQNSKVCRLMVQALFEDLIDSTGNDEDKLRRQSIMRTLVVFARASASLFKVDQLDTLKPYIKNLSATDDMAIYRSAIVIFRCVLPGLSAAHSKFLEDVATALLSNVSKLPMTELQEAIYCLAEINKSFDISSRLVAVFSSSMNLLKPFFTANTSSVEEKVSKKISRLICIIGLVGCYGPLEKNNREVRARLAKIGLTVKTPSISEFIVDTMLGFAKENSEANIRKAALEAVGNVAKSYPGQYMRPSVTGAFEAVFKSDQKDFKSLILKSLYDFLSAEERSSEEALKKGKGPAASKESVANADYDPGRLTGASTATTRDGVSAALSQLFLRYIVNIGLSSVDDYGFAAVELTGSVLRQGLVHPKECTPALVALMTCPDPRIQNIANRELKTLAQKHESIVERAYMEGFRLAFKYQLEVIDSEDGADSTNYTSKLSGLYALTTNSRKVKKKFLGNLLGALDFDASKLQVSASPSHLTYARFVLQNLAYFDYVSIEDVHQVASGLEKIVGNIGATVGHQIETDVLHISLENAEEAKPLEPITKRRLCMASVILTMCWSTRTYLRKLYGVTAEVMMKKGKNSKDLTKAPTRVVGMGGRGLWDEMKELIDTLETEQGMDGQFREFVELLTVDNEFKRIAEHEDDDLFGGMGDDESDGGEGAVGADGTPHRARGRPKKRKTGLTPPPQQKAKRRKKKADGSPGDDGGGDDGDD